VNFRPEMIAAIRRGKIETRRIASDNPNSPWYRGGCAFRMQRLDERPEKTYAITPGRGKGSAVGRLKLTKEPELSIVENITDLGAHNEGFESRDAFLDYFRNLNTRAELGTEVWVIRFAVVSWDEPRLLKVLMDAQQEKS
jgi:hypothetical protein